MAPSYNSDKFEKELDDWNEWCLPNEIEWDDADSDQMDDGKSTHHSHYYIQFDN